MLLGTGGPVGQPARWAATSNVKVLQRGKVGRKGREESEGHIIGRRWTCNGAQGSLAREGGCLWIFVQGSCRVPSYATADWAGLPILSQGQFEELGRPWSDQIRRRRTSSPPRLRNMPSRYSFPVTFATNHNGARPDSRLQNIRSILVLHELYELYVGLKFRNFTELCNEHGTLWNFTNFTFLLDNLSALFFWRLGSIPLAQTGLGFCVSVTLLEFALRERDCL